MGSDDYFEDPTVMQLNLKVDVYSIKLSSRLHHAQPCDEHVWKEVAIVQVLHRETVISESLW